MSGRLNVFVLRHGEPEDRTIFYGQKDVGLSPRGRSQVDAQADFFAERSLGAIVSSDLSRCTIGAEAIAARCGLAVRTSSALREMHLGVLEGVPIAEAVASMPELAKRSYADMLDFAFPEGGESVRTLSARVMPEVERCIRASDPNAGALLLYVHNTVARVVLAHAAGSGPEGYVRFEQRYAAVNRIEVDHAAKDLWARSAIHFANRPPVAAAPDGRARSRG
ncbi:MAG: histidine phosphatase family protein [Myxococcota bacterium]